MKFKRNYRSQDVQDRRRGRGRGRVVGGGAGLLMVIAVAVVFGPEAAQQLLSGSTSASSQGNTAPVANAKDEPLVSFVSFVLDDCQNEWQRLFAHDGGSYRRAKLVLFSGSVRSACGYSTAAVGPFYCPADHKAYIDLSFYRDLRQRLGAPGDFAQAYVIAHELGHHVQNLRGTSAEVHRRERAAASKAEANQWSVRLELQADCFAGVWAHAAKERELLDIGDIEEALGAAAAIGDDRLQKKSGRSVQPESWTHGSSAQRVRWFKRGFRSGSPADCDTLK